MDKITGAAAWGYALLAGVLPVFEYVLPETWHSTTLTILFAITSSLLVAGVLIDTLRGKLFSWPVVFMGYFAFIIMRRVPTIGDAIQEPKERFLVIALTLMLGFACWHFSRSEKN